MTQTITPDVVVSIAEQLQQSGLDEASQSKLRESYSSVRFTFCSDDDITPHAKPVAEREGFNLYLVGGDEHCLSLTNDYDRAAGVVCAEIYEDE